MYSKHHAVLSLVVSVAVVALLEPTRPAALIVAGTVAGTIVDLDHFPLSRVHAGDWRALRRVVRRPWLVVTEEHRIFAGARIDPLERLLTHAILGGVATGLAWLRWPALGVVVGATLYVHVLSDLVWDVRGLYNEREH